MIPASKMFDLSTYRERSPRSYAVAGVTRAGLVGRPRARKVQYRRASLLDMLLAGMSAMRATSGRRWAAILVALAVWALQAPTATAQYFRRPVSDLDPRIMRIEEKEVLGRSITPAATLVGHDGREMRWGDLLGKPLILVLSYYTCDGSCSIINQAMAGLLKDVSTVRPGEDFSIVTLSFDRNDTLGSTAKFRDLVASEARGLPEGAWTFATFKSEADLKAETERIGFKFFWSPEDRVFLHPGAFLFFSPKGELVRVLYQQDISARDVELAVLDARQGQFRPNEIINFALSLCYSYNYHNGKYALSIPLFVGLGALLTGLSILFGSILVFKLTKKRKSTGDAHAHAA